jgi:hypothetical protein
MRLIHRKVSTNTKIQSHTLKLKMSLRTATFWDIRLGIICPSTLIMVAAVSPIH